MKEPPKITYIKIGDEIFARVSNEWYKSKIRQKNYLFKGGYRVGRPETKRGRPSKKKMDFNKVTRKEFKRLDTERRTSRTNSVFVAPRKITEWTGIKRKKA